MGLRGSEIAGFRDAELSVSNFRLVREHLFGHGGKAFASLGSARWQALAKGAEAT